MAVSPKIYKEDGKTYSGIDLLKSDGSRTELFNVYNQNQKIIYHKHSSACKVRHTGYSYCGGRVSWGAWQKDPNAPYVGREGNCTKCGKLNSRSEYDGDGRPHTSGDQDTCDRQIPYDYYTYSCGFDA